MRRRTFRLRVREKPIHRAIVQAFLYAGRQDVKLVHVPNELAERAGQRIDQAALGMWPGCPDLVFIPPLGEPIRFVEAKRMDKGLIPGGTQDQARDWCVSAGHMWALINDPDQIWPTLTRMGLLRLGATTGGLL